MAHGKATFQMKQKFFCLKHFTTHWKGKSGLESKISMNQSLLVRLYGMV
jgi:hypothetical protein